MSSSAQQAARSRAGFYLAFLDGLVSIGEVDPVTDSTIVGHLDGGGGSAVFTVGDLRAIIAEHPTDDGDHWEGAWLHGEAGFTILPDPEWQDSSVYQLAPALWLAVEADRSVGLLSGRPGNLTYTNLRLVARTKGQIRRLIATLKGSA